MCQLSGTHRQSFQAIFFLTSLCPSFSNYKQQSAHRALHKVFTQRINLRGHNYYNHANFTYNGISSDRLPLQLYHKVLPQLRSSLYNYFNFKKSTFIHSECTISDLPSCLSARHFWSCWLNPAAAECSVLMKVGRSET